MGIEQIAPAFQRRQCVNCESPSHLGWLIRSDGPIVFHQLLEIVISGAFRNASALPMIGLDVDVRIGKNAEGRNAQNNWIVRLTNWTTVGIRQRSEQTLATRAAIFSSLHRLATLSFQIHSATFAQRRAMRDRHGPPAFQKSETISVAVDNKRRGVVSSDDCVWVLLFPVWWCTPRGTAHGLRYKWNR